MDFDYENAELGRPWKHSVRFIWFLVQRVLQSSQLPRGRISRANRNNQSTQVENVYFYLPFIFCFISFVFLMPVAKR
jgi:hypothetical protein